MSEAIEKQEKVENTYQDNSLGINQNEQVIVNDQKQNQIKPLLLSQQAHRSIPYRTDIDGLRAVAIIQVVIFHVYQDILRGGLIGVDVFFVISGYLITQILVRENINQTFSYYSFYNRRVKRIFPALIVVLLFTFCISIIFLTRKQFQTHTLNITFASFFGANLQTFTNQLDYKSLLQYKKNTNYPVAHLWSLGVEQQFYIFWPFLINIIMKKFASRSLKILTGFAIICFLINIISAYVNTKFDFYFPFCRFWQMAIGGILGLNFIKIDKSLYINGLSIIGLMIIIIVSIFLDPSTHQPYPGWWALLPTFASAAIIQAGSQSIINKYILSNPVMVFIGKISYSLYLWHQPLLRFSIKFFHNQTGLIFSEKWFVLLISVIVSILSFYLVQNPIRFRKEKAVFIILLVIMFTIGIGSFFCSKNSELIKPDRSVTKAYHQYRTNLH